MRTRLVRPSLAWIAGLALAMVAAPPAAQAQQGIITGTVVDARSGAPVPFVQVVVVGTQRGTLTGADGSFRIANVNAGPAQVTASSVGFRSATESVTVPASGTVTVRFLLSESAIALDEILVTGTAGRQERRAQAASVSSVDAAAINEVAPVTSVANLLQGRTTGVSINTSSGTSGATQRIRLRGSASLNLSNEPIVIVDGVRLDSRNQQLFGVGGQSGSRLNDISPEDIESIEVVKGPAAATLYGADASAGVIQIRTKRGRAGSGFTQNISYEYGSLDADWTPPSNWGTCSAAAVADSRRTLCFGQAAGTAVSDNPLVRNDVFRTGEAHQFSYSARGGGDAFGYFISFTSDTELGVLPDNEYARRTARVNFDFTPRDELRLDASMSVGRIDANFPQNDNNIYGYLGGALLGSPLNVGLASDGWFASNRQVEAISSIENENMSIRVTPIFTATYNPVPWFTNRLNFGVDMTRSEALSFFPKNDNGWYGTAQLNSGQISQARANRDEVTLDYLGSIRQPIGERLVADVAFGAQYIATRSDLTNATGIGLTTNAARSINAAATTTGGQSFSEGREGGIFGQLDLAWNDRFYLQLGGRVDKNSTFGAEVGTFFNPKIGASWVVSEESFYPEALRSAISTLRLRSVWGSTGRSPGSGASLTTFSSSPFAISASSVGSGVLPQNPGNAELEPERGVEVEFGFDASLFDERVGLEVTYYDKTSENLILSRPLPPSLGFSQNPLVNIGELRNSGWEVGINSQVLDTPNFSWDARLSFSTNTNEVTDLGDVEPFGNTQRVLEGFPANGYWTRVVQQFDAANNQAIVSDTAVFIGNPNPGNEGNVNSTFTFFGNLRLFAQLAWANDYILYNNSDQFRERQFGTGERWVRRNEILTDEERLGRFGPFRNSTGATVGAAQVNEAYFEDASFIRLREVSLSYTVPSNVAALFRANSATLTVAGRNLALWTDYLGPDPEVLSAATAGFGRTDFLTLPQPRRLVARVNLAF